MFVLAHELVTARDVEPTRWLAFLHGIYGRGANWRSIARKLAGVRPDWGYVLVDLRMHGGSQGAPPPHTVARAAEDLGALAAVLADDGRPLAAVSGHSFGGKVALELRHTTRLPLEHTFVLDASPSPRSGGLDDQSDTVVAVLRLLTDLRGPFSSRDDFVGAVEQRGFALGLAQWLAMNLERRAHGYELALDPAALRALLEDHYARDLWPAAAADAGPGTLDFVIAGKSNTVSADDRARLQVLAREGVGVVEIPDAGHWLHVDAGSRVVEILAERLRD